MAIETKECEQCGEQYEGKRMQKYCNDWCRDIMALRRKHNLNYEPDIELGLIATEKSCTGHCHKLATKNIRNTAQGWKFIKESSYAVKIGVLIDYCPFCGGRLT